MDKNNWKFLGYECLFMLFTAVAMTVAAFVQNLFIVDTGVVTGGIFSGPIYKYNLVSYILGIALLCVAIVLGYTYFFSKKMKVLPSLKLFTKIIYFVIVALGIFAGFFGEIFVYLTKYGLSGTINSDELEIISWFGWPIAIAGFMIGVFVLNCRKKTGESVAEVL